MNYLNISNTFSTQAGGILYSTETNNPTGSIITVGLGNTIFNSSSALQGGGFYVDNNEMTI